MASIVGEGAPVHAHFWKVVLAVDALQFVDRRVDGPVVLRQDLGVRVAIEGEHLFGDRSLSFLGRFVGLLQNLHGDRLDARQRGVDAARAQQLIETLAGRTEVVRGAIVAVQAVHASHFRLVDLVDGKSRLRIHVDPLYVIVPRGCSVAARPRRSS
jgi:hypothetical protein